MRTLIVYLGAAFLAGCGGSEGANNNATAATSMSVATPAHFWSYREGDEYGYEAALSEDDRKSGQAAGELTMFRYLGQNGGVYTVASKSPEGILVYATCTNPCQVIRIFGSSVSQRVAFNSASIVGEALTDAFNGQLEVYGQSAADRAATANYAPPPQSSPSDETSGSTSQSSGDSAANLPAGDTSSAP